MPESKRKSIRLKDFDYTTDAAYFVTLCIHNKECLFGGIANAEVELSKLGEKAKDFWLKIPAHFQDVILDEFIIMPNHIHGILMKINSNECHSEGVQLNAPTKGFYSRISSKKDSLGLIIRIYKSAFTTWCRKNGYEDFKWQRNYYEHIIRNEKDLNNIRSYIFYNPTKWEFD